MTTTTSSSSKKTPVNMIANDGMESTAAAATTTTTTTRKGQADGSQIRNPSSKAGVVFTVPVYYPSHILDILQVIDFQNQSNNADIYKALLRQDNPANVCPASHCPTIKTTSATSKTLSDDNDITVTTDSNGGDISEHANTFSSSCEKKSDMTSDRNNNSDRNVRNCNSSNVPNNNIATHLKLPLHILGFSCDFELTLYRIKQYFHDLLLQIPIGLQNAILEQEKWNNFLPIEKEMYNRNLGLLMKQQEKYRKTLTLQEHHSSDKVTTERDTAEAAQSLSRAATTITASPGHSVTFSLSSEETYESSYVNEKQTQCDEVNKQNEQKDDHNLISETFFDASSTASSVISTSVGSSKKRKFDETKAVEEDGGEALPGKVASIDTICSKTAMPLSATSLSQNPLPAKKGRVDDDDASDIFGISVPTNPQEDQSPHDSNKKFGRDWTPEEDRILREMVKEIQSKGRLWKDRVPFYFGTDRTVDQCLDRWLQIQQSNHDDNNDNNGSSGLKCTNTTRSDELSNQQEKRQLKIWTHEENIIAKGDIEVEISNQCRIREIERISFMRRRWTKEEDQIIIRGRKEKETWIKIAEILEGRTALQASRRFSNYINKTSIMPKYDNEMSRTDEFIRSILLLANHHKTFEKATSESKRYCVYIVRCNVYQSNYFDKVVSYCCILSVLYCTMCEEAPEGWSGCEESTSIHPFPFFFDKSAKSSLIFPMQRGPDALLRRIQSAYSDFETRLGFLLSWQSLFALVSLYRKIIVQTMECLPKDVFHPPMACHKFIRSELRRLKVVTRNDLVSALKKNKNDTSSFEASLQRTVSCQSDAADHKEETVNAKSQLPKSQSLPSGGDFSMQDCRNQNKEDCLDKSPDRKDVLYSNSVVANNAEESASKITFSQLRSEVRSDPHCNGNFDSNIESENILDDGETEAAFADEDDILIF